MSLRGNGTESLAPTKITQHKSEKQWNPGDFVSFPRAVNDGSSSVQPQTQVSRTIIKAKPHDSNSHDTIPANASFALIILNTPIEMTLERFLNLWTRGACDMCGWWSESTLLLQRGERFVIPSVIAGDFDSIEDDVMTFYKQTFDDSEVDFRHDEDQYSTDFDKAIDVVRDHEATYNVEPLLSIVALGGLAGRVDQSFSLIHQLFKCMPRPLYLISPQNISFLLHEGRNRIHASSELFGPCCGIIPIAGPTTITLEGFRWNLENFLTEFGGMISTSNEIDGDECVVITDKPILWTIELRKDFYERTTNGPPLTNGGERKYHLKRITCTSSLKTT